MKQAVVDVAYASFLKDLQEKNNKETPRTPKEQNERLSLDVAYIYALKRLQGVDTEYAAAIKKFEEDKKKLHQRKIRKAFSNT